MKAYRITHWDKHESYEGRRLAGMKWYSKPNNLQSLTYRYLVKQEDRNDLYCAWTLLLDVASAGSREERGWLVRKGRALLPLDLELITGFPEGLFERALDFFAGPQVSWIANEDYPATTADLPGMPAEPAGALRNGAGALPKPAVHSTVQDSTGDKTPTDKNRSGKGSKSVAGSVADGGAFAAASRTQWAALTRQIKELEVREEELSAEERLGLKQKRALLKALEERQAKGEF